MGEVGEHPILFSGPMVRAILDGRKTQTRRALTARNSTANGQGYASSSPGWSGLDFDCRLARCVPRHFAEGDRYQYLSTPWEHPEDRAAGRPWDEAYARVRCRWEPGDLLWVKETWQVYRAGTDHPYPLKPREHPGAVSLEYRASPEGVTNPGVAGWRPSILMPRWASRITLEVTGVRVERVQQISEASARAEGADPVEWSEDHGGHGGDFTSYRVGFSELWDSINSARGYGWDANPWVWVVEFRRIEGAPS